MSDDLNTRGTASVSMLMALALSVAVFDVLAVGTCGLGSTSRWWVMCESIVLDSFRPWWLGAGIILPASLVAVASTISRRQRRGPPFGIVAAILVCVLFFALVFFTKNVLLEQLS